MDIPAVIRRAADLIEQPGKWTQGCNARAADGGVTMPSNGEAVCWCAFGAIMKIAIENDVHGYAKHCDAIVTYNDQEGRTASEVATKMRELAQSI